MATFNIDVVVNNRGATAGIGQVNRQLSTLDRTVNNLARAFVGLFAFRQVTQAVQQIGSVAEAFNRLERSASIAVGPTGNVGRALESIQDTARQAGAELATTGAVFQRFALASRAAGLEQAEVARITDTLIRGFAIFTSSSAEANSAITQLSQAFSSGRLAGDEFRSVSENFPPLLRAISEVTGVAEQDLRDFAAQGNITTDVLIAAFSRLEGEITRLEQRIGQNLSQILNRVSNEFQLLVAALDDAAGASELFRAAAERIADVLQDTRIDNFGGTARELGERLRELQEAQVEVTRAAEEQNPVIAALFGAYANLDRNTEQLAFVQGQLSQNFAAVTQQIREADQAATFFASSQGQLLLSLDATADAQELQARAIFNSILAYEELREEIGSTADELARQEAITEQGIRLQETFSLTLRVSAQDNRDAAAAQQEFNDILESSAFALENNARLTEEYNASVENLSRAFASFAGTDFINVLENLSTLVGDDLTAAFEGLGPLIAEALDVDTTTLNNALSGVLGLLGEFGVELEDIFGNRVTRVIQLLGAVSNEEFTAIGDVLGGVVSGISGLFGGGEGGGGEGFFDGILSGITGLFGGAEQSVSSFGQSSFATLTSFNSSIGDLQAASTDAATATQGLGNSVGGIGAASEQSLGSILATAGAISALAGGIAQAVGVSEEAQVGATVGAGLGAVVGGFFGGVGGAAAGGAVGGAAGGFFGDLFSSDQEAKAAREFGRDIGNAVIEGIQLTPLELFENFSQDEASAAFARIELAVGGLNEALVRGQVEVNRFTDLFGNLQIEFDTASAEFQLDALANAALTAAAQIADSFDLSVADVAFIFNSLPPELAGTFDLISQNAAEIADILVEQFGLSKDQVVAILQQLGIDANNAFLTIDDGSRFLAAKLAENFGGNATEIARLFDDLPPGIFENFNDIAANADLIARRIAVSFGLSFEEARALILQFAADAGLGLSDVGTTAGDVAGQISNEFSGTDQQLRAIFLNIARIGVEEFENIRIGADGQFELINEGAQARLEEIVATFGGTSEDIQVILGLLAGNADISFGDIFASGVFAFENLSASAIQELSVILTQAGLTAEQIAALFGGIGQDGQTAFEDLEQTASITLSSILLGFGATEDEILAILAAIAESGETSFSDIQGAGGEALRAILDSFGLTAQQIDIIFNQISLGADSDFADIANRGGTTAAELQAVFQAALEFLAGLFGNLQGEAASTLGGISTSAFSTSRVISSSFSSAASSAVASLGRIRVAASAANSQIANTNRVFQERQFADGGLITGPVALGGAGAGRAFQTGGILGGLTSIFGGGVVPTNQLGIAGEAGPEAIFPLDRIGGQLGVTATIPDSLIAAIQGGGGGAPTVITNNRVFFVRDASREDIDRLEEQILDVDASVEVRADAVVSDILSELVD